MKTTGASLLYSIGGGYSQEGAEPDPLPPQNIRKGGLALYFTGTHTLPAGKTMFVHTVLGSDSDRPLRGQNNIFVPKLATFLFDATDNWKEKIHILVGSFVCTGAQLLTGAPLLVENQSDADLLLPIHAKIGRVRLLLTPDSGDTLTIDNVIIHATDGVVERTHTHQLDTQSLSRDAHNRPIGDVDSISKAHAPDTRDRFVAQDTVGPHDCHMSELPANNTNERLRKHTRQAATDERHAHGVLPNSKCSLCTVTGESDDTSTDDAHTHTHTNDLSGSDTPSGHMPAGVRERHTHNERATNAQTEKKVISEKETTSRTDAADTGGVDTPPPGENDEGGKPETWVRLKPDSPHGGHYTEAAELYRTNAKIPAPNIPPTQQLYINYDSPYPTIDTPLPRTRNFDLDEDQNIDLSQCDITRDQKQRLAKLLHEYSDVFGSKATHVVGSPLFRVDLLYHDYAPYKLTRPIAYAPEIEAQLQKIYSEWETAGIARPIVSEHCVPVVAVKKKSADGTVKWRPVLDNRVSNERAIPFAYIMPTADEIFRKIPKWSYCTVADFLNGYYNLLLGESCQQYSSFIDGQRRKRALMRLPQGDCRSAGIFQTAVDHILRHLELLNAYLDDAIQVSIGDFEDHLTKLRLLFQRARWAHFIFSSKKMQLFVTEAFFLGQKLTREGISAAESGIEAIQKLSKPKNLRELRTLLGMLSYHCQGAFPRYAETSLALYSLANSAAAAARKSLRETTQQPRANKLQSRRISVSWTHEHDTALDALKHAITTAPIRAYISYDRGFVVQTDASDQASAGILSQPTRVSPNIIAFYSRRFRPEELSWSCYRKEGAALVAALLRWRHIIFGQPVVCLTDCRAVVTLFRKQQASAPLTRLWLLISQFNVTLVHVPGTHMGADALTRVSTKDFNTLPLKLLGNPKPSGPDDAVNDAITGNIAAITPSPQDAFIIDYLNTGILTVNERPPSVLAIRAGPGAAGSLREEQEADPFLTQVRQLLLTHTKPHSSHAQTDEQRAILRNYSRLSLIDGVIRRRYRLPPGDEVRYQYLAPLGARDGLLKMAHSDSPSGHGGIARTAERLRGHAYWPHQLRDVVQYIASCDVCTESQHQRPTPATPVGSHRIPQRPGDTYIADCMGPIGGNQEFKYIFAVLDEFSRHIRLTPVPNQKASTLIQALSDVMNNWGYASTIRTDAGSAFLSKQFADYVASCGAELRVAAGGNHQSIGLLERANEAILHAIKAATTDAASWPESVQAAAHSFNSATHSGTGYCPFEVALGYIPSAPLSLRCGTPAPPGTTVSEYISERSKKLMSIYKAITNTLHLTKAKRSDKANSSGFWFLYRLGDRVAVAMQPSPTAVAKLTRKFESGFEITAILGYHTYKVQRISGKGKVLTVHADRLRPAPLRVPLLDKDGTRTTSSADTTRTTAPTPPTSRSDHSNSEGGEGLPRADAHSNECEDSVTHHNETSPSAYDPALAQKEGTTTQEVPHTQDGTDLPNTGAQLTARPSRNRRRPERYGL